MNWLKRLAPLKSVRRQRTPGALHWRPQLEQLEQRRLLSVVLQGIFTTGNTPRAVAIADVNGDGKLDLAVVSSSSATVSVLLGNGNATFAAKQDFSTGSFAYSVAVADITGDGRLDLITSHGNTVGVLPGN